ncbi:hypothetical protein BDP67DRAFT_538488 [Colletotrichum lupini]|nr:hypothetical protein BDP67DRAFT_538488 [Colletotrichum lupini]
MIYRLCCIRQSRCEWRATAAIPRMSAPPTRHQSNCSHGSASPFMFMARLSDQRATHRLVFWTSHGGIAAAHGQDP